MKPHRQPVGRRDVENAVEHEVRRIERGDVALGDEGNAQAEPLAPEREPALRKRAGQLALERAIQPVRVAADRLVADEQPAQDGPDHGQRADQRDFAAQFLGEHEEIHSTAARPHAASQVTDQRGRLDAAEPGRDHGQDSADGYWQGSRSVGKQGSSSS